MPRPALALLFLSAAGCTWNWHQLAIEDAGPDLGLDAGPPAPTDAEPDDAEPSDAGPRTDAAEPSCDSPVIERCAPNQLCARPAMTSGCCAVGACLEPGTRPVAWARDATGDLWSPNGTIDEPHWTIGMPRYPLAHLAAGPGVTPEDASAWFMVAWNSQYLRLYVHIDDEMETFMGATWPENDAIVVFVDMDPTSDAATHENRLSHEARFARLEEQTQTPGWLVLGGGDLAVAGGRDLEVDIPFGEAGISVREGVVIGLDVAFRDRDGSDPIDTLRWSYCGGVSATRDSAGLLVLAGDAAPTGFAACPETCGRTICAPSGFPCSRAGALTCP